MAYVTNYKVPKLVGDQIEVVMKELSALEDLLEKLEELEGIPVLKPKVQKIQQKMYFSRFDAFLAGIVASWFIFMCRKFKGVEQTPEDERNRCLIIALMMIFMVVLMKIPSVRNSLIKVASGN